MAVSVEKTCAAPVSHIFANGETLQFYRCVFGGAAAVLEVTVHLLIPIARTTTSVPKWATRTGSDTAHYFTRSEESCRVMSD